MIWVLGIVGLVLSGMGVVWIGQGAGSIQGSPMTGHIQWTYFGAILLVVGLAMILTAYRKTRRR